MTELGDSDWIAFMFATETRSTVLNALLRGRYSLLLGAGFSASSHSADGRALPVGNNLAVELAKVFNLPHYPLISLVAAIPPAQLDAYFQKRFHGCRASADARRISSFVWQFIFTLNVDDVLNDCYSTGDALQRLSIRTGRDPFEQPEDPGEVYAVHLHGSVRRADHGYVFSSTQYGAAIAADSVWQKIMTDQLLTQPCIMIGCTFAEPDIETYLARREGLKGSQQIAPSIFVTRKMDPVLKAQCDRFGMIPVEADSDAFFQQLSELAGPRPSPLELVLPKSAAELTKGSPSTRSQRLFFRQWVTVTKDSSELPTTTQRCVPLLQGVEPRWNHIVENEDVIRGGVAKLVTSVADWAKDARIPWRVQTFVTPAGEGKSVMLMRICVEVAKSGFPVFYYQASEALAISAAQEVLAQIRQPFVIVVDSLAEHANQVVNLLDGLAASGARFYFVGAERFQRMRRVDGAFVTIKSDKTSLSSLGHGEALAFVQRLRSEGLLGRAAKEGNDQLATRLEKKDLLAAILSLGSNNAQLDQRIYDEWLAFPDELARAAYATVALAHALGYGLRMGVLQRALNAPAKDVVERLETVLKGNILGSRWSSDKKETRHRVVAERLLGRLQSDYLLGIFVGLARAIAPYVNRDAIKAGTDEARLTRRLLNYDDAVAPCLKEKSAIFYTEIRDEWQWNSRYWEQRALLELAEGNTDLARSYAEQAVGTEYHPFPLTTLSKVHFYAARVAGTAAVRDEHVEAGIRHADEALRLAREWRRVDVYPYDVAVRGILDVLESDEKFGRGASPDVALAKLRDYLGEPALRRLFNDETLTALRARARAQGASLN